MSKILSYNNFIICEKQKEQSRKNQTKTCKKMGETRAQTDASRAVSLYDRDRRRVDRGKKTRRVKFLQKQDEIFPSKNKGK